MGVIGITWEYLRVIGSTLEYFGVLWSSLEYFGVLWSTLEYLGVNGVPGVHGVLLATFSYVRGRREPGKSIKDPGITRTGMGFLVLLLYETT